MFSVVIPLYNKAHTIVGTLSSVLAQDFPDFEVVVVDDGSTDGGSEIVEREFSDPRIRMIRQERGGDGAARNTGVAAARRDLIALLDADDLWLPGYLSEMKRAVELFPESGMYCCGGVSRYPNGSGSVRQSPAYGNDPIEVNYFENPFFFGNASSTVFARHLHDLAGGFPVGMPQYAEVVFFFTLALKTDVVFCPALLTVYNLGVPGQLTADRRANMYGIVASSNQIYEFWVALPAAERNPVCRSALVQNLRYGIRYALVKGDYRLMGYFFDNTDPRLLAELASAERFLYPRPMLRVPALALSFAAAAQTRLRQPPSPRFSRNIDMALASAATSSLPTRIGFAEPEDA